MSAQIIQLDTHRLQTREAPSSQPKRRAKPFLRTYDGADLLSTIPKTEFEFWTGASGKRYVHTTYTLLGCPQLPAGNYILVHRSNLGHCKALAVGRTTNQCQSLNLAEIRRLGASLSANEVHVHLLAGDGQKAQQVECDLHARCFSAMRWSTSHH